MSEVLFKRGLKANLPSSDPNSLIFTKLTAGSDYDELYMGDDLIGVGHVFSTSRAGLAPASDGSTEKYLCADGLWKTITSGGGSGTDENVSQTAATASNTKYPILFKQSANATGETGQVHFGADPLTSSSYLAATPNGALFCKTLEVSAQISAYNGVSAESGDFYTERGDLCTDDGALYTDQGNIYASNGNIYTQYGDIIAGQGGNGYFKGLLYPNINIKSASILTDTNQPIEDYSTEDNKPVTAKNVYNFVTGNALMLSGGTMEGSINMGGQKITNVGEALNNTDVPQFQQVLPYDTKAGYYVAGAKITDVATPTTKLDAANKGYVDTAIDNIDLSPSFIQDTNITTLDGSKDFNIAYFFYIERGYPSMSFSTPMSEGTICHIFTYYCGTSANPGSYGTGYMYIPNDICVGGQPNSTNNYVWINGVLKNGGIVDGTGSSSLFVTPSKGMLEINVAFTKFGNQYRTIIKVDSQEIA